MKSQRRNNKIHLSWTAEPGHQRPRRATAPAGALPSDAGGGEGDGELPPWLVELHKAIGHSRPPEPDSCCEGSEASDGEGARTRTPEEDEGPEASEDEDAGSQGRRGSGE